MIQFLLVLVSMVLIVGFMMLSLKLGKYKERSSGCCGGGHCAAPKQTDSECCGKHDHA